MTQVTPEVWENAIQHLEGMEKLVSDLMDQDADLGIFDLRQINHTSGLSRTTSCVFSVFAL